MKKFILKDTHIKAAAIHFISKLPHETVHEVIVREHKTKRSLEQNALLWKLLTDLSNQVDWYGHKLTKEDWKCVMSSALHQARVVPNIDGTGFVSIGLYTSKMSVKEMNDLITLIQAFGSERGAKWTADNDTYAQD